MSINVMDVDIENVDENTPMMGRDDDLDRQEPLVDGLDQIERGEEGGYNAMNEDSEETESEEEDDKSEGGMGSLPRWILVLVCITLLVTFLNSLLIMAKTNPALNTIKDRQGDSMLTIDRMGQNLQNLTERVLGARKFAAPRITPRTFQRDRGTCWDFATVNLLEWNYRDNGVKKGYLNETEYVAFSQQAYGMSMIRECKKDIKMCEALGDGVAYNSTEGGELGWLYYFKGMYSQLLPVSVCPYPWDAEGELVCPNMDTTMPTNPVRYNIDKMTTTYNVIDTKNLMLNTGRPLGWSSLIHVLDYHFPCNGWWATQEICSEENRVLCPVEWNEQWCGVQEIPCYNQQGEFYDHDDMIVEGGHCMNAVGFNDDFVTHSGDKGGFIIKNSWEDKNYALPRGPRGSHSIKWWMQDISDWDERRLCPNPLNPDNWLSCLGQPSGPRLGRPAEFPPNADISSCLKPEMMDYYVRTFLQPTEFVCSDSKLCGDIGDRYRYFLLNSSKNVRNDLMKVCFVRYDNETGAQSTVCTPDYLIPDVIALTWQPIKSQADFLQDSDDYCGFYFFPYRVIEKQVSMYAAFYATDFEVTFEDGSYESVGGAGDYTEMHNSTFNQGTLDQEFSGPYAWNDIRVD